MAGRLHGEGRHRADAVGVAVLEEPVELAAVAAKVRSLVEDLAEGLLHDGDVCADAKLPAELALNVGRRRQVVCVDVRLEQPLDRQTALLDEVGDFVGMLVGKPAGGVVYVE